MPILKIVQRPYLNSDALDVVIHNYVLYKALALGGFNVDPQSASEQMHMVKEVYGQTSGTQLRQFVLSFSDWETERIKSVDELKEIACRVCYYYAQSFQIIFGVHNDGRYHIHFVMNTVSFCDGSRYHHRNADDNELAAYTRACCFPWYVEKALKITRIPVYYN